MKRWMMGAMAALGVMTLSVQALDMAEYEKVIDQMMVHMDKFVGLLKSVTDKASAEKAAADLVSVGKEMKALGEQADKMDDPSAEQETAMEAKYGAKMQEVQMGLMQEMMRIGTNPELNGVLKQAFEAAGLNEMMGGMGEPEMTEEAPAPATPAAPEAPATPDAPATPEVVAPAA